MRTLHITKQCTYGHGHHCWDVRIDGQAVRRGLTKKQATDWIRDHEKALKAVLGQVVSRELELVAQFAQSTRDGWRG